jgi:hypothetical protein
MALEMTGWKNSYSEIVKEYFLVEQALTKNLELREKLAEITESEIPQFLQEKLGDAVVEIQRRQMASGLSTMEVARGLLNEQFEALQQHEHQILGMLHSLQVELLTDRDAKLVQDLQSLLSLTVHISIVSQQRFDNLDEQLVAQMLNNAVVLPELTADGEAAKTQIPKQLLDSPALLPLVQEMLVNQIESPQLACQLLLQSLPNNLVLFSQLQCKLSNQEALVPADGNEILIPQEIRLGLVEKEILQPLATVKPIVLLHAASLRIVDELNAIQKERQGLQIIATGQISPPVWLPQYIQQQEQARVPVVQQAVPRLPTCAEMEELLRLRNEYLEQLQQQLPEADRPIDEVLNKARDRYNYLVAELGNPTSSTMHQPQWTIDHLEKELSGLPVRCEQLFQAWLQIHLALSAYTENMTARIIARAQVAGTTSAAGAAAGADAVMREGGRVLAKRGMFARREADAASVADVVDPGIDNDKAVAGEEKRVAAQPVVVEREEREVIHVPGAPRSEGVIDVTLHVHAAQTGGPVNGGTR